LTVDGRSQFVTVNRVVAGQPRADAGTVTPTGYQPVTFTDIEKLAIVNTLGTTGFGGFDTSAYTKMVNYPATGKKTRAVAIGNVDTLRPGAVGNNWQDFVAVNSTNPSSVTVYLNTGNGTFNVPAAAFAIPGLKQVYDVALADMDGDGLQDVVTVGQTRQGWVTVVWLRGDGFGNFVAQAPATTTQKAKGDLVTLSVGDVNGGLPDVVIGSYLSVTVFNNVAGVLTPGVPVISGGKNIRSVQMMDLDHSGSLDIAVANYRNNSVTVWLNNGAGVFTTSGTFATGNAGKAPTSMVIADFDNDGNYDIAVADGAKNALSVLLGFGDGTFHQQIESRYTNPKRTYQAIAAGDFNSDGKADLVLGTNHGNYLSVLLSNGNGTFSDPYNFMVGDIKARQPAAIALGDFNNDGGIDIAVANAGTNDVSILLRTPVI
jgi:hypothetical protein